MIFFHITKMTRNLDSLTNSSDISVEASLSSRRSTLPGGPGSLRPLGTGRRGRSRWQPSRHHRWSPGRSVRNGRLSQGGFRKNKVGLDWLDLIVFY